ncbi:hypothetical protein HK102_000168, partial [Quaeritorhiza haematococci]
MSDDTTTLQELVANQAAQIERLTAEKDGLLVKVETTESSLKHALELHLKQATEEKQSLDNSMHSLTIDQQVRAQDFESKIRELRMGKDG